MALPLTWRQGAANPFAHTPEMRSIPVRDADHDLRGPGQSPLERAQAAPAKRRIGRRAAPQVDDPASWVERRAERLLLRRALGRGQLVVRERRLDDVVQSASHLQRGLVGVVVAGVNFDYERGDATAAYHRSAR